MYYSRAGIPKGTWISFGVVERSVGGSGEYEMMENGGADNILVGKGGKKGRRQREERVAAAAAGASAAVAAAATISCPSPGMLASFSIV